MTPHDALSVALRDAAHYTVDHFNDGRYAVRPVSLYGPHYTVHFAAGWGRCSCWKASDLTICPHILLVILAEWPDDLQRYLDKLPQFPQPQLPPLGLVELTANGYRYTHVALAPASVTPVQPCGLCYGRIFHTHPLTTLTDAAGRPQPRALDDWACVRCTPPLPESHVALYQVPPDWPARLIAARQPAPPPPPAPPVSSSPTRKTNVPTSRRKTPTSVPQPGAPQLRFGA